MRKVFRIEDIDCPNCAAKIERAIAALPGVTFVSLNFFAEKLTLEAEDQVFDAVLQEAIKCCKKVEPDCTVYTK